MGSRGAVLLLVLASSLAAARAPDPLTLARRFYNQGQLDQALVAARQAASNPATASSARLVIGRIHLERYRQDATAGGLDEARKELRSVDPRVLDATRTDRAAGRAGGAALLRGALSGPRPNCWRRLSTRPRRWRPTRTCARSTGGRRRSIARHRPSRRRSAVSCISGSPNAWKRSCAVTRRPARPTTGSRRPRARRGISIAPGPLPRPDGSAPRSPPIAASRYAPISIAS